MLYLINQHTNSFNNDGSGYGNIMMQPSEIGLINQTSSSRNGATDTAHTRPIFVIGSLPFGFGPFIESNSLTLNRIHQ